MDPKTPENYRTGPQEIAQGSAQPSQTMGSPGTLPLMGEHPLFGNDPQMEPRLEETSFTLPRRTPKP